MGLKAQRMSGYFSLNFAMTLNCSKKNKAWIKNKTQTNRGLKKQQNLPDKVATCDNFSRDSLDSGLSSQSNN